jgi:hypothetical protein
MSQNETNEVSLDKACMVESTNEFVDEVSGSEIAEKLFEQIQQLRV